MLARPGPRSSPLRPDSLLHLPDPLSVHRGEVARGYGGPPGAMLASDANPQPSQLCSLIALSPWKAQGASSPTPRPQLSPQPHCSLGLRAEIDTLL